MDARLRYRFPGMDPWLEQPGIWPSVHDALIIDMARAITAQVAPAYVAWPGRRMVVELPERVTSPDVAVLEHPRRRRPRIRGGSLQADEPVTLVLEGLEVQETLIEIRSAHKGQRLVTVVEVLSLANKRTRTDSREKYVQKQEEVLASDVHRVEIDLLRGGEHTVAFPPALIDTLPAHHYRVTIRRTGSRDRAQVFPIGLRERLPCIPVPLLAPDPDAVLDLQALIEHVYEAGAVAVGIDYSEMPEPPLSGPDARWARQHARSPRQNGRKR